MEVLCEHLSRLNSNGVSNVVPYMPILQQNALNSDYNYLNTYLPKSETANSSESSVTLSYPGTALDINRGNSRRPRLEIEPMRTNKTEESVEISQDEGLGVMELGESLKAEEEEGELKEKENLESIAEVD